MFLFLFYILKHFVIIFKLFVRNDIIKKFVWQSIEFNRNKGKAFTGFCHQVVQSFNHVVCLLIRQIFITPSISITNDIIIVFVKLLTLLQIFPNCLFIFEFSFIFFKRWQFFLNFVTFLIKIIVIFAKY